MKPLLAVQMCMQLAHECRAFLSVWFLNSVCVVCVSACAGAQFGRAVWSPGGDTCSQLQGGDCMCLLLYCNVHNVRMDEPRNKYPVN